MCSLERTHASDLTLAIVSPIPIPAKFKPLGLPGVGVVWNRLEWFGVVRSRSESFGVFQSRPESSEVMVALPSSLLQDPALIGTDGSRHSFNFALTLYHRWVLRAQVLRAAVIKNIKSNHGYVECVISPQGNDCISSLCYSPRKLMNTPKAFNWSNIFYD